MKTSAIFAVLLLATASLIAQTNPGSTAQLTNAAVRSDPAVGSQFNAAAMRGDIEKARALLADHPDYVFSKDEHGWTPLYWAAASGRKEVVQLLLANKADINALNQHFTPLHAAVMNRHPDVADLLIASNAEVTVFDAAAGGYVEILKAQLKTNAALVSATDDSGWTPLQFAARNGQLAAVKFLLASKADVNAGDRRGMTPLEAALAFSVGAGSAATNHEAIAKLLLANGATVTDQRTGAITPLHYAAGAGLTSVVKELLARHANVNAKDSIGRTPLDFASQHNHMDVIELLVAGGAKMSAEDKAGLAALKDSEKGTLTRPSSPGHEYEVEGKLNQTITENNGASHSSATFRIYVRDCGWLIATTENYQEGNDIVREVGSANGTEIYQLTGQSALVQSNTAPIGWLDREVAAHLWLMFASQCYWPSLNSDQLIPVYDWRASSGAGGSVFGNIRKVSADWELLNGPGSLPREVRYLDVLNHTNAIYTITGTNRVGGMLFPAGFVFKQFNGERLVKHVEVEVTAIRPVCSRASLIPLPSKGITVIDARIDSGVPNRPSTYQNPMFGQWLSAEEAKTLAGINTSNTLRNLARVGIAAFPETRAPMHETNSAQPELSLSIRCTNEVVKAGDEIDIEFRITNRGTNDYKYEDRTYDRSGRMNEYTLVATNSSGEAIPDPRAGVKWFGLMGGLFQYATLKPGDSFTKVIPLNRWALIKEAGQYKVAGTYLSSSFGTNFVTVNSDPIRITVQPRTPEEMDAYISDLTNRLEAKLTGKLNPAAHQSRPPDPAMNELVTKLMFTCNPKIVPSLLDSMCDYGSGGGFWENEAIMYYVPHSEETKRAILATATARGLGQNWTLGSLLREMDFTKDELKPLIERALAADNEPGWGIGAELAQKFGDDAFTERLIAIANATRSDARSTAISALAAHRTEAGVRALKSLLDDPHEKVWAALANGLENGYDHGIFRSNDFTAQDVRPLIKRTLEAGSHSPDIITGVNFLEQFYDDEFTPQLIAIANDTDNYAWHSAVYALAYNRTDDGVKALKSLLNSSKPEVQKVAARAIHYAYTERGNIRGRQLQPDDFDKEYQQPEIGK